MNDKKNEVEKKNRHIDKLIILISVILISIVGVFMLMAEQAEISNVSKGSIHAVTLSGTEQFASAEEPAEIQTEAQPNQENKVNINTATKTELILLNGIGDKKAESIIAYRKETPFKTIEEFMNVDGIGRKTYEKNKDSICVK